MLALTPRFGLLISAAVIVNLALFAACGEAESGGLTSAAGGTSEPTNSTSSSSQGGMGGTGGEPFMFDASVGGGPCEDTCSTDFHSVVDCHGFVQTHCMGTEGCDLDSATCMAACQAAENNKLSFGCEYYATFMDQLDDESCFAVFVANTWSSPAHLSVEYDGNSLPVEQFARIPKGMGATLTYGPFDPMEGIAPGEMVILFLAGPTGMASQDKPLCPVASAVPSGVMLKNTSGIGKSFRISTDVPVVAYQINPYGGGSAAITGASLLLPTSSWDTNYIALNAYDTGPQFASMNIVAKEDGTEVTMVPPVNIEGGPGLPPGSAKGIYTFTLDAGQHAQFTQQKELTGSIIQSTKPVGFMAGARCSFVPTGVYACDHLEQMIPPVRALGHKYAAVMHRSRSGEPGIWRVMGMLDGTTLTWSNDVGGPATLDQGQVVEFATQFPFVVQSQDDKHPFVLMAHMSGGSTNNMDGVGDADAVLMVPPDQYMKQYVFFADTTYPETNLVIIRAKDSEGNFQDVTLDCAGPLAGWKKLSDYEWTRIDLSTGDFQPVGNCTTGRHEITSPAPFGLWVWGWGSHKTSVFTKFVSYGYPGGMSVRPINTVVIPPK